MSYPIVYVKWEDHWAEDQSWTHIKKLQKKHRKTNVYIVESVGFLLQEEPDSIMLGLSVAADGMVDGNIVLMKKNILERKELNGSANPNAVGNKEQQEPISESELELYYKADLG